MSQMQRLQLLLLCMISGCLVLLEGLLSRPRAGKLRYRYYNKDAIKSHIKQTQRENVYKAHATSTGNDKDEDITTATDQMWASCEKRTFTQYLDHFGSGIGPDGVTTFEQRYYLCGKNLYNWHVDAPIFFYFGNEADVTAYIDYTGLMWQHAADFNALLIFAEHRYYGESLPYTQADIVDDTQKLKYLTTDQALQDYATLIDYLKKNTFGYAQEFNGKSSTKSALIGFGGSYGGMLASWFRMKYPQYIDGVIAASSPIWGVFGLIPAVDPYAFSQIVTYDASAEVGVDNELCQSNIKQGWTDIMQIAATDDGRAQLKDIFNLCSTPKSTQDANVILSVVDEALSYMAMSSYPYSSNYISGAVMGTTSGGLPAYPMSYACNKYLTQQFESAVDRVTAIGMFNAVFWNSDGDNQCIDTDTLWDTYTGYIWDYLYCRSLLIPDGSKGGDNDMLYPSEWDVAETVLWCNEQYDINVDSHGPASRKYGGRDIYKSMSNIVFSNGDMDPWMPGGVLTKESESLVNIMIADAGHHLDLMFANSNDPQSVIDARKIELENIQKWIKQANSKWNMGMCDVENVEMEISPHPLVSAMSMLL